MLKIQFRKSISLCFKTFFCNILLWKRNERAYIDENNGSQQFWNNSPLLYKSIKKIKEREMEEVFKEVFYERKAS